MLLPRCGKYRQTRCSHKSLGNVEKSVPALGSHLLLRPGFFSFFRQVKSEKPFTPNRSPGVGSVIYRGTLRDPVDLENQNKVTLFSIIKKDSYTTRESARRSGLITVDQLPLLPGRARACPTLVQEMNRLMSAATNLLPLR